MSQKVIIGILGGVILVGGGVWFYQSQYDKTGSSSITNDKKTTRDGSKVEEKGILGEIGDKLSGSFIDLTAKGKSAYCTFDGIDPETNERVEGSIYASGQDFFMEADTVIEGTDVTLRIIQKDRVMYMWSDNEEVMPGMKIDMSMFPDDATAEKESPIAFLKEPDSGVDYSCRVWIPRSSVFEPPEDVEFHDMFGGMMGAFGAMMEGGFGEDTGSVETEAYGNEEMEEQF